MLRPLVLLAIIVALAVSAAAQPATAQEPIDMSGSWQISFLGLFDNLLFDDALVDYCSTVIEQVGEELSATASCPVLNTLTFEGTIDPGTGSFSLSSGGISWEGQILSDGVSVTGTWAWRFIGSTGSLTGERIDDIELVDISGIWDFVFLDDVSNTCALDIEQGLVSSSAVLDCDQLGVSTLEGEIDPFTGTLSLQRVDDLETILFGEPGPDARHISGDELSFGFSDSSSPSLSVRPFVAVPAGELERGIVLVGCRRQNMFLLFCGRQPGLQSSDGISAELAVPVAPSGGYTGVEAALSWPAALAFGEATPSDQCANAAAVSTTLSLSLTCSFADQSDFTGDLVSFTVTCAGNTGATVLEFSGASFIGADPDLGPPALIGARASCLAPLPGSSSLLGDTDCSEEVTSIDAALTLQFVARLTGSLACQTASDTTKDGRIDSRDVLLILQMVAGLL